MTRMGENPSRPGAQRARELVDSISKELGFVSEKTWKKLSPEVQQEFRDAFQKKDNMIFTSVSV